MKRLFVLSLVAVLGVGLLSVGAFAQPADANDSDSTYVEWQLDAPMQCSLVLTAHDSIDLGTLETVGATYWASDEVGFGGNRQVTAESNCTYTVNVTASVAQAPIPADQLLADFVIQSEDSGGNTIGSNQTWTWDIVSNGASKTVGNAGNTTYSDTTTDWWQMDYSYTTDYDDVNDETYRVALEYTASTA